MEPICLFFGWFRKKEKTDKKSEEVIYKNQQNGFFIDPRDGNQYKWIKIGNQIWMAENLAYLPSVSPCSEGSGTDPYHYVYDYHGTDVAVAKETENYKTYGVLYNYPAAMSVCPEGWHLPSDAEWTQFENYLISKGYNFDGTTTDSKIAKSIAAKTNWLSYSGTGVIGNNLILNNRSGFSALPGGYRLGSSGTFFEVGNGGTWWSSTEGSSFNAWGRHLYYRNAGVCRVKDGKAYGFSVRCVRD